MSWCSCRCVYSSSCLLESWTNQPQPVPSCRFKRSLVLAEDATACDHHLQEPVLPGCFLRARAIGLMPMIDQVPSIHATSNPASLFPVSSR
jgi:hypothetical protein